MIERLFASRLLRVGVFRCPPDASLWSEVNEVDSRAIAVFPATSVWIEHVGRAPVLANRNHVMFYNEGQRYRRRLHDARGDYSVFVAPARRLIAALTGGRDQLPFVQGPGATAAYLAQHRIVRHLRSARRIDRSFVEETLCRVLARVVADAIALERIRRHGRPATLTTHHLLVEETKALLTERATEHGSLGALARELHTSEFHLARIFRASTGFTLHGYRTQLRLRLALELLDEPALDLGDLAHMLGFASHSHFTDAFRAAFGAPPSAVRGRELLPVVAPLGSR